MTFDDLSRLPGITPADDAGMAAAIHRIARDEPTDTWTITNRAGEEIARVDGATSPAAADAARGLPAVVESAARDGGFRMRRLLTSEL